MITSHKKEALKMILKAGVYSLDKRLNYRQIVELTY